MCEWANVQIGQMNYQHKHNETPQIGSFDTVYNPLKITNRSISYVIATMAFNMICMQFSALIGIEKPAKISH